MHCSQSAATDGQRLAVAFGCYVFFGTADLQSYPPTLLQHSGELLHMSFSDTSLDADFCTG